MAKPKKGGFNGKRRKTKDKGDEPEMRKGSLDLQPIELKSDDFHMHFKSMKGAKEKMATAKSLYDSCCKAAKRVNPKLLEACKKALGIEGKDMADVRSELEVFGFVLKETAHAIQLSIHDTLLGDVNDQAYARGEKAGAAGMPMACPYPDGSDLSAKYAEGWRSGQSKLLNLPLGGDGSGLGHNSRNVAAE